MGFNSGFKGLNGLFRREGSQSQAKNCDVLLTVITLESR